MSNYFYELENNEIDFFLNQIFSFTLAKNIIRTFDINVDNYEYNVFSRASKAVLVYSESDYSYSSAELNWLDLLSDVVVFSVSPKSNIICINVECKTEEYLMFCAVAIKLFNIAFLEYNFFIFKVNYSLAFGSKKSLDKDIPNNFCVTQLFQNQVFELCELLEELSVNDITDYDMVIHGYSAWNKPTTYDKKSFDPDYLCALDEIMCRYGIDTSQEKEWYTSSFNDESFDVEKSDFDYNYKEICFLLSGLGENGKSSYDEYMAASENTVNESVQLSFDDINGFEQLDDSFTHPFSSEAFDNAEQMLEELLSMNSNDINNNKEVLV